MNESVCINLYVRVGSLFSFDVHEDIRLVNDAGVEKDEVQLI